MHRHFLEISLDGQSHLDDVEPSDQLSFNVHLRISGPVGVGLQSLSDLLIRQDIKAAVLDAVVLKNLHHLPAKACNPKKHYTR